MPKLTYHVVTNPGEGGDVPQVGGYIFLKAIIGKASLACEPENESKLWTNDLKRAYSPRTYEEADTVAEWLASSTGWAATTARTIVVSDDERECEVIRVV